MADFSKVMIARIAWSEMYSGGKVLGGHKYLKQKSNGRTHTKNGKQYSEAAGHEAYNFLPYENRCYGYIPPTDDVPPNPGDNNKKGWLVIFVAPYMGYGESVAVGWYENATFEWETNKKGKRTYMQRPHKKEFPKDSERKPYTYCVWANKKNVHFISPNLRLLYTANDSEAKKHLGRTCVYLSGHKSSISDAIRKKLMSFVKNVVKHNESKAFDKINLSPKSIRKFCPPPTEVKKEIEDKAVKRAIAYYGKEYNIESVERENLGWDLTVTHKKTGEELYVEVKGTSRPYYHFFLSRNEYNKRKEYRKKWVLFLVKDVGRKTHPPCTILKASEVKNTLTPFAYEGEYHPKKKKINRGKKF
jgi:hypothetical protein